MKVPRSNHVAQRTKRYQNKRDSNDNESLEEEEEEEEEEEIRRNSNLNEFIHSDNYNYSLFNEFYDLIN
ncbi:unnamed protein product [Schistosoma curassoni]|uniref:Uncharacterized protein n=1 Tax=Schistosoma curassoni TaxID=6186 RepID=A0A183K066_9TREM|nr:unnamed protein product [Schistosoma curassoni]